MSNNLNKFDEILMSIPKGKSKSNIKYIQSVYSENQEDIDFILSAKTIFLDEYCRNSILSYLNHTSQNFSIREIREKARQTWNEMKDEDRALYEKRVNFNKDFYSQTSSKDPKRVNAYNLFTRDTMASAKDNNTRKTIVECAHEWQKASKQLKEIYREYSDFLREEKDLQQKGLYIADTNLSKVNLPWGPFKYYVKKLLGDDKDVPDVIFIKEAAEKWNKLSVEERSEYIRLAEREHHDFVSKRLEYVLQIRNKNRKPRTAFNLFHNDIQSKYTNELYRQGEYFDFLFEQWNNLDKDTRLEYESRAEKEKSDFIEENERINIKFYKTQPEEESVSHLSTEVSEGATRKRRSAIVILQESDEDDEYEEENYPSDKKHKKNLKYIR